jgi:hypothetical protein
VIRWEGVSSFPRSRGLRADKGGDHDQIMMVKGGVFFEGVTFSTRVLKSEDSSLELRTLYNRNRAASHWLFSVFCDDVSACCQFGVLDCFQAQVVISSFFNSFFTSSFFGPYHWQFESGTSTNNGIRKAVFSFLNLRDGLPRTRPRMCQVGEVRGQLLGSRIA